MDTVRSSPCCRAIHRLVDFVDKGGKGECGIFWRSVWMDEFAWSPLSDRFPLRTAMSVLLILCLNVELRN